MATVAPTLVPLPRLGTLARIEVDMLSADPRVAKGGIQAACEHLETRTPKASTRKRISSALSYQLTATDPQVRRWGYKAIALLQSNEHQPYLRNQLAGGDLTPENRTWAVAALAGMVEDYREVVYAVGDEQTLAYDLSSGMYGSTRDVGRAVDRAIGTDNPLSHQWLGLLYGDGRIELPASVLYELTACPYPEVVEYTIWGIRKRHIHGASVVAFDPVSLANQPANVRRWYCRLVAQSLPDRNAYEAQVIDWIEYEKDPLVLEGLARGLHESPKDKHWRYIWRQWRSTATDPFVRRALGCRVSTQELARAERDRAAGLRPTHNVTTPLDVDRSLPFLESDPMPFRPGRIVPAAMTIHHLERLEYNVNTTHNNFYISGGSINSLQGSGNQVNTGSTHNSTADAAAALNALADLLRAQSRLSSEAAEAEALAVEAANDGGTPDAAKTPFWVRVRGLTQALRAGNAAIDVSQDLIDNLDQIVHMLPPQLR